MFETISRRGNVEMLDAVPNRDAHLSKPNRRRTLLHTRHPQTANPQRRTILRPLWLLYFVTTLGAGLLAPGCETPTANLVIVAPNAAVAGSPITVTVAAEVHGNPDTVFNSVIHFTSSDPSAVLPIDYLFTAADAGSHTFTNGVTLVTPGAQTISVVDTATSFLNATAKVTVTSADSASNFK